MKVLVFTSLYPNSLKPLHGVFVHQRISALARRDDVEVRVIAPVPYAPRWIPGSARAHLSQIPSREQIGNIDVSHPRYPLIPKISMPLHGWLMFHGALNSALDLRRDSPIDCIDAHYLYPDGFAAVLLGRRLGVPVCVTARGSDASLFPLFPTIRPMIGWTIRNADQVIAVSDSSRRLMQQVCQRDDIRVVANGFDPTRFHLVNQAEARARLGVPDHVRVVLCVASLVPVKNHARLLQSFAKLHSSCRLFLVGAGPLRRELEQLATRLRVDQRVTFVGAVRNEELRDWYSAADVTCLASDREGWPNVLSESLACGTPAVVTDAGGCAEVICSEHLGIVVDRDIEQLALGLHAALNRRWDRERISAHGRSRTWDLVAEEMFAYLSSAIESKAASLSARTHVGAEPVCR